MGLGGKKEVLGRVWVCVESMGSIDERMVGRGKGLPKRLEAVGGLEGLEGLEMDGDGERRIHKSLIVGEKSRNPLTFLT